MDILISFSFVSLFTELYCKLLDVLSLVSCKVLSFVDGAVQAKVDLIWESEPKYIGKYYSN